MRLLSRLQSIRRLPRQALLPGSPPILSGRQARLLFLWPRPELCLLPLLSWESLPNLKTKEASLNKMPSLKAKQLLFKAAQISQQNEEKISRKEIEKKINQIKYLADDKKITRSALKKEIVNLEKHLQGIFALEKKFKSKEKNTSEQISSLKSQIKELKEQLTHTKDLSLRKKINRVSFLLGELVSNSEIRKEAEVQKALQKLIKVKNPLAPLPAAPSKPFLTLKKIDEFQEKIIALKKSGKVSPEKITALEQRLTNLEKRMVSQLSLQPEEAFVKHQMLFGDSSVESTLQVQELEKDLEELPLPPPPKIKRRK